MLRATDVFSSAVLVDASFIAPVTGTAVLCTADAVANAVSKYNTQSRPSSGVLGGVLVVRAQKKTAHCQAATICCSAELTFLVCTGLYGCVVQGQKFVSRKFLELF